MRRPIFNLSHMCKLIKLEDPPKIANRPVLRIEKDEIK